MLMAHRLLQDSGYNQENSDAVDVYLDESDTRPPRGKAIATLVIFGILVALSAGVGIYKIFCAPERPPINNEQQHGKGGGAGANTDEETGQKDSYVPPQTIGVAA